MISRWLGFTNGESFAAVFGRYRGVAPGFDLLRLVLAVTIFAAHAKWLSGTSGMDVHGVAEAQVINPMIGVRLGGEWPVAAWSGPLRPMKLAMVPMFFALSGFLITLSALRLRSTSAWLAHRGLRIFPALIMEVTLSAIILGALFTTLPYKEYYLSEEFRRYFGNIVGHITYFLPGVFTNNPVPKYVNLSLWTLQAEFLTYAAVAILMAVGVLNNRKVYLVFITLLTVALTIFHFLTGYATPIAGPYSSHVVAYYALIGVLFALFRDLVPARIELFLISVVLSYVFLLFDATTYLAPVPLTYATIFFGVLPIPRVSFLRNSDYSYGIYLYSFPVTQALLAMWPEGFVRRPLLLVPTAFLVTITFAIVSWHTIERRAIALKRYFPGRQRNDAV